MSVQSRQRLDAAIQQEDWGTAAVELRGLLGTTPGSPRLWLELSYVESFLGHYRAAADAAMRAKRLSPTDPEEVADLIARLRTFNDAAGVGSIARELLAAARPGPGLLVTCAVQLSNLGDHTLASECAERAAVLDAGSVPARLVRGQMRAQGGDLEGAEQDFSWCVAQAPHLAPAWWALSRLRRQTRSSNHVTQLEALLARAGDAASAAYAAMALHKELDDLGEFEAAWRALAQGGAAKRSTLRYDMHDTRRLVDDLVSARLPAPPEPCAPASAGPVPVFIVGMHRSGTTLLEQLLDASGQVLGVGELYDFTCAMREATDHHCKGVIDRTIVARSGAVDFGEVGRRYLQGVAWRLADQRFFTDKLPSNFLNLGFICRALPQARILHLVRDPVETCFSNLRELFSDANPYSYDQRELADYFLQYRRLMAHWHDALPGRVLDVPYADLVRDTAGTMRAVSAFCGIEYRDAMQDPRNSRRSVATASAIQVREGVTRRERPKWAPYAQQLAPLIAALRAGGIHPAGHGL